MARMYLSRTYRAFAGLLLIGLLALAACTGTSTGGTSNGNGNGNGNGTPSTSPTTAPTATAKPKPTGVPPITEAYCQQLMTVAEANSIMQPTTPATQIAADNNAPEGGSCNYEASQTNFPLIIYFAAWNGPVPIPQNDIAAALAQATGSSSVKVNTFTTVSGIGAQAAYLDATATHSGVNFTIHIFYVLEGPFFFDCFAFSPLSPGSLGTQAQLQQCATQVDSRL